MCMTITIKDEDELRSFVNLTNTFKSYIDVGRGYHIVDAKSILGVMGLGFCNPVETNIITSDENEMVRFCNEIGKYRV